MARPAATAPSAPAVDEQGFCALMIPAGTKAAELLTAFADDPKTVALDELQLTAARLAAIRDTTDGEFRDDAQAHLSVVEALVYIKETGNYRTFDPEAMRTAGTRTVGRCMKYTN